MASALEQQIIEESGLGAGANYYEGMFGSSARYVRKRLSEGVIEAIQKHADAGDAIAPPNQQLMKLVAAVADGGPATLESNAYQTWFVCVAAVQAQIAEYHTPGIIAERVIPELQTTYAPFISASYIASSPVFPTRTIDPQRTINNVGVVLPSEEVLRPIARRLFAGMNDGTEGPDELSVATFVTRLTTQVRSADTIQQFARGVLGAVQEARRADGRKGRAELDRFDVETAIQAVEELAPVLELKGSNGPLDASVVAAARDAIVETSTVALYAKPTGDFLAGGMR